MFKKAMLSVGAFAVIASSFALATPADAKRGKHRNYNSSRYYDNGYNNPYRGQRYRNYYRECDKGRGGTAIGAVAGGLAFVAGIVRAVLLHRFDAVLAAGLVGIALADEDDLPVAGLQVELEIAVAALADDELACHGNLLSVVAGRA